MACALSKSVYRDSCKYQVSGVTTVILFDQDIKNERTFNSNGLVDSITLANGKFLYMFEMNDDSASFSDSMTIGSISNKFREHTLNGTLNWSDSLYQQVDSISLGRFCAVVFDHNGNILLLGWENGLNAKTMSYESGALLGDSSGYTIQLSGLLQEPAIPLLNKEVILDLVAP